MLIRYKTGPTGKPVKQALIYPKDEHQISQDRIDFDAIKITRRLQREGFEAYIVGGAVRDLLLGKHPKDFDIATSAEPNQIRKIFRNSRIIGKRFRLVHIFFPDNKIIEVSTFRSRESEGFKNVYGDIEEDALRRDFTMNGLYYDPQRDQVIDFTQGFEDIKKSVLRPIIPLKDIFTEDPVRTLRGVKYAVTTGSQIPFFLGRSIKRSAKFLADVSSSRISEEIFKILQSGKSKDIMQSCMDYKLFPYLLPEFEKIFRGPDGDKHRKTFLTFLFQLDSHVQQQGEARRSRFLSYLCAPYFYYLSPWKDQKRNIFTPAFQGLKVLIRPLSPANKEVEQAVIFLSRQKARVLSTGILVNTLEKDPDSVPLDLRDAPEPDVESGRPRRRRRRRRGPPGGGKSDTPSTDRAKKSPE